MDANKELAAFFRDVVVVLGGIFAVHPPPKAVIREVARGLDRAYRRATQRKATADGRHPAFEQLLRNTRAGGRK